MVNGGVYIILLEVIEYYSPCIEKTAYLVFFRLNGFGFAVLTARNCIINCFPDSVNVQNNAIPPFVVLV